MNHSLPRTVLAVVTGLMLFAPPSWGVEPAPKNTQATRIDFDRQIRPLLASRCYKCHGPDEPSREGDLRLDSRSGSVPKVITPGKPEKSELVARISSRNAEMRMPPPDSNLSLTAGEIKLLQDWIAQGAEYNLHWSFVKPRRLPVPTVKNRAWPKNKVDNFILARQEAAGIGPSPEADRPTLLRRLSFDLTGLPPTPAEISEFLADNSPRAYEKAVDRLLDSPRYGERMAQDWLDLARYGDTNGYHFDSDRQMWLYRDWVIRAFNSNLRYDQFVIEQLAGDLLPNPTIDQRIATGFSRNCTFNEEGGADPDEYLVVYAVDRVATTGAVFLGLTLGCAQCHDHKYDPISQREFYSLTAFFNNVAGEVGAQGHDLPLPPLLSVPSPAQARDLAALDARRDAIETEAREVLARFKLPERPAPAEVRVSGKQEIVWIEDGLPAGAEPQGDEGVASWTWVTAPEHPVFSGKKSAWRKSAELSQHFFTNAQPELKISAGDKLYAYVYLDPNDPPKTLMLQFNDGLWEHRAYWGENLIPWGTNGTADRFPAGMLPATGKWERLEIEAAAVGLEPGASLNGWAFTQVGGSVYWDKCGLVTEGVESALRFDTQDVWEAFERTAVKSKLTPDLQRLIKLDRTHRTEDDSLRLKNYYLRYASTHTRELLEPFDKQLAELDKSREALVRTIPTTMVMVESAERAATHVLIRGDFEQRGEAVQPDVPKVFPALAKDAPRNRLALAKWLVSSDHPLTARVAVNRLWKQLFGVGLVRTPDDFGAQGEYPTHPELLDALAVDFQEDGWNVKALQRQIVMSAAYRQSSAHRSSLTDPENRLLWRQNRFRHSAETLRDGALAASGLLSDRIGGPSVFPYQPANYFGDKGRWTWTQSSGDELYRRGLYTFWRRTTFYPSFQIFDAPSRESCTVDRPRTNTPLQALVTLNDPTFVEAARVLGQRIVSRGGPTFETQLTFAFRVVLSRPPTEAERKVLAELFEKQLARYQANPRAALALCQSGQFPTPTRLNAPELAAWTAIGNVLLNLDETLTRE